MHVRLENDAIAAALEGGCSKRGIHCMHARMSGVAFYCCHRGRKATTNDRTGAWKRLAQLSRALFCHMQPFITLETWWYLFCSGYDDPCCQDKTALTLELPARHHKPPKAPRSRGEGTALVLGVCEFCVKFRASTKDSSLHAFLHGHLDSRIPFRRATFKQHDLLKTPGAGTPFGFSRRPRPSEKRQIPADPSPSPGAADLCPLAIQLGELRLEPAWWSPARQRLRPTQFRQQASTQSRMPGREIPGLPPVRGRCAPLEMRTGLSRAPGFPLPLRMGRGGHLGRFPYPEK